MIKHFFPQIYTQMYTHSNYRGDTAKLLRGIHPPSSSCFGTPAKHNSIEFTTVTKYLFVHSELNTLPSLLIFSRFQSLRYATQQTAC